MCDIWKRTGSQVLTREALEKQAPSLEALGVEHVVFTGGEPLLHPDLPSLTGFFAARGIRRTLLTSGLLLERRAAEVAHGFDEIILSLDGPPGVHDAIRGVDDASEKIAQGIATVRSLNKDLPIHARCTVQRGNFSVLAELVRHAAALGLQSISFLAADVDSSAFHRELVWPEPKRTSIAVAREEIDRLSAELEAVDALRTHLPQGFTILESREKLLRIANHFRACAGLQPHRAPVCNAPWVSLVWEVDGQVRPCFFHKPIGKLGAQTLAEIANGEEAVTFRAELTDSNPICQRCVCSLNYKRQSS